MLKPAAWSLLLAGLLISGSGLAGCSSGSNLPKPRAAADDDEEDQSGLVSVSQLATIKLPSGPSAQPNPNSAKPATDKANDTSADPNGTSKPTATASAGTGAGTATKPAPSGSTSPPTKNSATSPGADDTLSPTAVRQLTIERLDKISQAMEKYYDKNGCYPAPRVISATSGAISWRVQILPQLGLGALYARYSFQEPWDGPNNSKLLAEIPDVYQSPGRPDDKTNFLLVTGAGTAYPNPTMTLEEAAAPDGLRSTILLAEVASRHAVPWTQPDDFAFDRQTAHFDLFAEQQDCCLALFGNALGTRRIPADIADADLLALLSPAGREKIDVAKLTQRPTPEIDVALIESLRATPPARFVPVQEGKSGDSKMATAKKPSAATDSDAEPSLAGDDKKTGRWAIPTETELQEASALVRDLFAPDYEKAKKTNDRSKRKEFVKKMIEESEKLGSDQAGIYVILRAAKEIGLKLHDFETALDAADRMVAKFEIDEVVLKTELLEQATPNLNEASEYQRLYTESLSLGDQALAADDFNRTRVLYRFAMLAARQLETAPSATSTKDGDAPRRTSTAPTPTKSNTMDERERTVTGRENRLRDTRHSYARLSDHLHTLQKNPSDPAANAAVGRYFCLIKRNWDLGLPKLLQGSDANLRKLAELELAQPQEPVPQVTLADAWWEWSEKATIDLERDCSRLRAIRWYREAVSKLEPGLVKARAEKRIAQSALLEKDFQPVATGTTRS
ncbi:MAG: DUF1559 domain-containing protein [Planctomycetota bacterium]